MKAFTKEYRHTSWLILAVFAGALAADAQRYEGYKVVSATTKSDEHIEILRKLQSSPEIDFWAFSSSVGGPNTFSVSPNELQHVLDTFKDANIPSEIIIENLQETLDLELEAQRNASSRPLQVDNRLVHDRYYRYDEMVSAARDLEKTVPYLKTRVIGKTKEGRDIVAILLSKANAPGVNPVVLIDAGMRAREWIAPAVATYFFDTLATNKNLADELLFNLDWYIVPNMNPDGYEWTFRDSSTRMWLKNRNTTPNQNCLGVDINRNFDYQWNGTGSSQDPCADNYCGTKAFSEAESIALRDFVMQYKSAITMYLSLQSYGPCVLYPWAVTQALPVDADLLQRIGDDVNRAMVAAGSQTCRVGSYANQRDLFSGSAPDYMYGVQNIRKVFTMILPSGGNNGYDVPTADIRRTADIAVQGLREFAKNARLTRQL